MVQFYLPVMVVIHSRRSVLMSVNSQAPANVGAERDKHLGLGMSCFDDNVEGPFSICGTSMNGM